MGESCKLALVSVEAVLNRVQSLDIQASCRNCTACGQVVEGQHFSSDVTFTKGADGESAAVGQYVSGGGTGPSRIAAGRIYNQASTCSLVLQFKLTDPR